MSQANPESPKRPIPPSPGETIKSQATGTTYTFGAPIGEGFFGIAYACTDTWDNELAAKILKPTGTYEEVKARAAAEFQKLFTLRHPNITYVYDAFEYRDTFYIITERCHFSGHDLLSTPGLESWRWVEPVAGSLLQAVHYLHLNKFVHQDIHLGNVLGRYSRDELQRQSSQTVQFKLGDLGIARLLDEVTASNTRAEWMIPPEVLVPAEFGPTDARVDIYHLGLLLLQLAVGRNLTFTRQEVIDGQPRQVAQSLQRPLSQALERALRRHVEHRTPSAMELWRDLRPR